MNDTKVIEAVRDAFKDAPRPSYFAHHKEDCDECIAADLTLDSRTVDTITIEDLHPGISLNNPLGFINLEGFRYYFPAFVRLCLEQPAPTLTSRIISHLIPATEKAEAQWTRKKDKKKKSEKKPQTQEYSSLLTQSQKEATLIFLKYLEAQEKEQQLKRYRKEDFEDRMGLDWARKTLEKAIEIWEGLVRPL